MSDDQRGRPRRIEIPAEIASGQGVPEDLDADVVGPHAVPDVARRRRAGTVYFTAGLVTAVGIVLGLPVGMWLMVVAFAVIGLYHLAAGWRLHVREGRALELANHAVGFPVGHASAVVGFVGWRSRPVWNVLVFSADDPPSERGLVRVDATDGTIVDAYVEGIAPEAADEGRADT